MKYLHDLLCGAVVGVANIIPGVSGGTMALAEERGSYVWKPLLQSKEDVHASSWP